MVPRAPFTHPLRVRYAECDPQQIVFNANYFAYFDIAMTELWRAAAGSYGEMLERGIDMVVAEASARFLGAARFDDELVLEVAISAAGQHLLRDPPPRASRRGDARGGRHATRVRGSGVAAEDADPAVAAGGARRPGTLEEAAERLRSSPGGAACF